MHLRSIIKSNLKNIPGKRLNKKYVVIECDDWGGIRMPSKVIYRRLLKSGLINELSRFNADTLETATDLEKLFKVLDGVKDQTGHSAIMTPFVNVVNPDFRRIKESGFTKYFYEKFTDTLINYGRGNEVFDLWKQGQQCGIFIPELHGREHIAVHFWLEKLIQGEKNLLFAFDNGFVSLEIPGLKPILQEFRAEFYFENNNQLPFLKSSIIDAVNIFKDIFKFQPRVFVPPNAVFNAIFENDLIESGIKYLYTDRSKPYQNSEKVIPICKRSMNNLILYTRNCAFEPTDNNYKGINHTLMQISSAFRWGKPAIISSHRVNFVGGINPNYQEKGLNELNSLLKTIIKTWPDVEFISSCDALENYAMIL